MLPVLALQSSSATANSLPQHCKTSHTKLRGRFSHPRTWKVTPNPSSLKCRSLRLLFLFIASLLYGSYTENFTSFQKICQDCFLNALPTASLQKSGLFSRPDNRPVGLIADWISLIIATFCLNHKSCVR